MNSNYTIRKASILDVAFLADVIIGAEKSMSDNLGLALFFGLDETELKKLIVAMLEEEVDGCEFSISSFFLACHDENPVGALGGWLEGYYDDMPSSLLKSNLIGYVFPKENIIQAQSKFEIIKDIQFVREKGAYQLEYSFVDSEHRGRRLTQQLMKAHLDYAQQLDPDVRKAQLQPFENNKVIIGVHEKTGFRIVKRYVSHHKDILDYMPYNAKVLMERPF